MKENFNESLKLVLVHEGGFANHPKDPGGATMKGVTLLTFRSFFGAAKTVKDLRNITQEQLGQVYRTGYWDKCGCDKLAGGVDYAVFDVAVNSGPGRALKFLEPALKAASDAPSIINNVCDRRLAFLRALKTFSTFGKGWTRRVEDVRVKALQMARGAISAAPAPVVPSVKFDILRLGSKGKWVEKLQGALKIKVDGDFGPNTEKALKAFQKKFGLNPDGIAGRVTFRALGLIA